MTGNDASGVDLFRKSKERFERFKLRTVVEGKLGDFARTGNPAMLADPTVLAAARVLFDMARKTKPLDLDGLAAAGRYFWSRQAELPPDDTKSRELAILTFELVSLHDLQLVPAEIEPYLRTVNGRPPSENESQAAAQRGAWRLQRAQAARDLQGVHKAVADFRNAVQLATDPASQARHLNDLGAALQNVFDLTGDLAVLDEAIAVARQGIEHFAPGDGARPIALNTLGGLLFSRAEHTGGQEDLKASIISLAKAREGIGPTSHCIVANRSNLALALLMRFEQSRNLSDLDDAIALLREALDLLPAESPSRPTAQSNLAKALTARFERTTSGINDLEEAVGLLRSAYARLPPSDARRPAVAMNLSTHLRLRFRLAGDSSDAEEAVRVLRETMALLSPDDQSHDEMANHLSDAFSLLEPSDGTAPAPIRAEPPTSTTGRITWAYANARAGRPDDSIREMKRIAYSATASVADQLEAGIAWARIATDISPAEALTAYTLVLDLIPSLARDDLDERSRLHVFSEFNGVPSAAAALAIELGRPETAIELLDHGRLLWWAVLGATGLPDRMSFARLSEAAAEGPVIVLNAGPRRCDALVVTSDRLMVVPLNTPLLDLRERAAEFAALWNTEDGDALRHDRRFERHVDETLTWLTGAVTAPVLTAMRTAGLLQGDEQRVWWCPTGLFSGLPWHACVLDDVVSSYAPSLRTLLTARQQPSAKQPRLLAIGVRDAPGLPLLPDAADEAREVATLFAASLPHGADVAEPTVLLNDDATRDRVLAALPNATWLHVACHASQSFSAPLDGGIALADRRLAVADLLRLTVPSGEFAFLSACETAQVLPGMTDELVTVAMTLHRGGYPSVVATGWSLDDEEARTAAATIYRELTAAGRPDGDRAAWAVHRVTKDLRARYPRQPSLWAAYLHVGR